MESVTAQYGQIVSEFSNMENLDAAAHLDFALQTLALGQATLQSGQPIVESAVNDALQAVEQGEVANPSATDWASLRKELEALLEKSEEQEQQDQDQEESDEEQEGEEGEQDEQEESEDGEESEDSEDGEQGEESEEGEEGQESDEQQDGEQQDEKEGSESEQKSPPQDTESLGEMEDSEEDITLDQQPPPQKQEPMQNIGGTEQPQDQEPVDAQMAQALQQLEKIKQQDDPGKLHMLLQQAEGTKPQKPSSKKDW
tara:strand:+ start:628 stop:1395 length:768 start_codon:yes stop_codon:yes gene_type:complete